MKRIAGLIAAVFLISGCAAMFGAWNPYPDLNNKGPFLNDSFVLPDSVPSNSFFGQNGGGCSYDFIRDFNVPLVQQGYVAEGCIARLEQNLFIGRFINIDVQDRTNPRIIMISLVMMEGENATTMRCINWFDEAVYSRSSTTLTGNLRKTSFEECEDKSSFGYEITRALMQSHWYLLH